MNSAQIHLALNHLPLFLSVAAGIILVIGYFRNNELLIRVALFGLIGAALFTIPVFLTGEPSEELIEKLPGVNEGMIEEHESMAKIALIVIAVTGLLALGSLFTKRDSMIRSWFVRGLFILSLGSFLLMAQTARLGGKIRHSELGGAALAVNEKGGENENNKEKGSGTGKDKEENEDD